ncbi:hypothetical protein KHP62_06230 [Rhodobacteraceae bacterium NNCM2]|nr:hypothetical protein [Coraliihabitans acroporae]
MATLTQHSSSQLGAIVSGIVSAFSAIPSAFAATEDYRRLEGMTDAQLAEKGLKRSDLAREIYKRHFA